MEKPKIIPRNPELQKKTLARRASAASRPPLTAEKVKANVKAHLAHARSIMSGGGRGQNDG
jgi:hypothetical protein